MPKYVIERELPGAHDLNAEDLRGISEKSNSVLAEMGGDVQWLHSYVAEDRIFCVYIAPDETRVREHANRGGFPAKAVRQVSTVIDPTTGGL
ncbi:MAG: DUF4242 domain-containing protein [Acidimicrobiales bacterium]